MLLASALVMSGCGGDGPSDEDQVLQTFHDTLQAIHERDGKRFCSKLFPSTALPPRVDRALGLSDAPGGSPKTWDQHYRGCVRDHRKPGAFHVQGERKLESIDAMRKRFTVRIGPRLTGAGDITRTATTVTKRGRRGPRLIKYRGDWKVVYEVN